MAPKRKFDAGDIPESSQTPAGIADGDSPGDASLLHGGEGPGTNTAPQTTPPGSQAKRHAADVSVTVSASHTGTRTAAAAAAAAVAQQRNDQPLGQSVAEGIHPQQPAAASAASMEALLNTEQPVFQAPRRIQQPVFPAPHRIQQPVFPGQAPTQQSVFPAPHRIQRPVVPCQAPTQQRVFPAPHQIQQPVFPGQAPTQQPVVSPQHMMFPEDTTVMQRIMEYRNALFARAGQHMRAANQRTRSANQAKAEHLETENARLTGNLESEWRTVAALRSKLWLIRRGQLQTLGVQIDLGSEWTNQADARTRVVRCWACLVEPATVTILPCRHRCLCATCFEGGEIMVASWGSTVPICCPICDTPASPLDL